MAVSMDDKRRWVVNNVSESTVAAIKALATTSGFSMGEVLDLAVEYFSRKIRLSPDVPMKWDYPDDF